MTEQATAGILNLHIQHLYKNEDQQFIVPVDEIGLNSIDHSALDNLKALSHFGEEITISYLLDRIESFEVAHEKIENGYNLILPENFNVFIADEAVLGEKFPELVSRNIVSSMMNHVRDAIINKDNLVFFNALQKSIANIEELFYC